MTVFVPDEYDVQFSDEVTRFNYCVDTCQYGIKLWVTSPEFPRCQVDNLSKIIGIPVILLEDVKL